MRPRWLLAGALSALALAVGCPPGAHDAPPAQDPPPARTDPPRDPTEPGPPPPAPPAEPGTPEQVAGPAPPRARIPHPDEGVPQTSLLASRALVVGGVPLQAWIADGPDSRRLGLMHVRSMPEERGMLFIYPEAGRRSFWMKNTYIPLSLAYIRADGVIDQLVDMQPLDTTSHPSTGAVKFILEVNQGWFARHAVEAGARVEGLAGLRGH